MAAAIDAWSSDWAELRARNRRSWSLFFGIIALLIAAHALGLSGFAAMMLIGPCLVWIVIANWRRADFLCPRCGRKFFRKRLLAFINRTESSRRDCIHCGLGMFTPSYKA